MSWFGLSDFGAARRAKAKAAAKRIAKRMRIPRLIEWEDSEFEVPIGPRPAVTRGPAGTHTVGKPKPGLRRMCGCGIDKLKSGPQRGREILRCPIPGRKKGVVRFISKVDLRLLKRPGVKNVCAFVPMPFGTPGAPARRRGKRPPYAFKTAAGKSIVMKRKPKFGTAKKMCSYYYHNLRKRLAKRGVAPRHMPAFGDICGGEW